MMINTEDLIYDIVTDLLCEDITKEEAIEKLVELTTKIK